MQPNTYKKIKLGLFVLVVTLIFIAVFTSNAFIAFFAVGLYMGIISLLRTRVEGFLADERQIISSEKAAQVSFQILLPLLLLTSIALIASAGDHEFFYLKGLGIVFSYVTCLGLVIYRLAYWYFDRKTGGSND